MKIKETLEDIKEGLIFTTGKVVKVEDKRHSSTHVTGGDTYSYQNNGATYYGRTPVKSHVQHHQNQKIWLSMEGGKQDSYNFYNKNINVLEGHDVTLISGKNTHEIFRLKNNTTGYYWWLSRKPITAKGLGYLFFKIYMSFRIGLMSLLAVLPGINFLFGLAAIFGDKEKDKKSGSLDFLQVHDYIKVHRLIFILCVLLIAVTDYFYFDEDARELIPNHITLTSEEGVPLTETYAKAFLTFKKSQIYVYEVFGVDDVKRMKSAFILQSNKVKSNIKKLRYKFDRGELKNRTTRVNFLPTNNDSFYITVHIILSFIAWLTAYLFLSRHYQFGFFVNKKLDELC